MEIRQVFKEYLMKDFGYTEAQIVEAWQKVQNLCRQYNPVYLNQLLILEVMTRDLLEGRDVEAILKQ